LRSVQAHAPRASLREILDGHGAEPGARLAAPLPLRAQQNERPLPETEAPMITIGRGDASPLPTQPLRMQSPHDFPQMFETSEPWYGGTFNCSGGSCTPVDGRAHATVQNVNRLLGVRGRMVEDGFDMGTLRMVNGLIMAGHLRLRPFHSTSDLAAHAFDVLKALIRQPAAAGQTPGFSGPFGAAGDDQASPAPRQLQHEVRINEPPAAKVRMFQQLLRTAGARDDHGRAPKVDGKLGPSTLQAAINLQKTYGNPPTPIAELRRRLRAPSREPNALHDQLGLDDAIAELKTLATSTMNKPQVPSGTARVKSTVSKLTPQKFTSGDGDFLCAAGVCQGRDEKTTGQIVALQQLLNSFPAAIVAQYPKGKPLVVDGKLGPSTLTAIKVVTRMRAASLHKAAPADLDQITPQLITSAIDKFTAGIADALPELQHFVASATAQEVATVLRPTFHVVPKVGTAVGNRTFRCLVMALQTQANRLGQHLKVDGVLGQNTVASINKILGRSETAEEIASAIQARAVELRTAADHAGAPPPPAAAMKLAISKCAIESKQPVVDARLFKQGTQTVAVKAPTPAPPVVPTPTAAQPIPTPSAEHITIPPEEIARLRAQAVGLGLTAMEADAVIRFVVGRGGTAPDLLQALQVAIDTKAQAHEAAARAAAIPVPAPAPVPVAPTPTVPAGVAPAPEAEEPEAPAAPAAPTAEEQAQLVSAAVEAGLDPAAAQSLVTTMAAQGHPSAHIVVALQKALAAQESAQAPAPEAPEPEEPKRMSTGLIVGLAVAGTAAAGGIGYGLYRAGKKRRR
jgi:lysozyme family protein